MQHCGSEARFFRAVQTQPFLSAEEEADLAARALAGDQAAERQLVCSHLRFVLRMARAYGSYGLPLSDLVQEGTLALIQAIRRYDPSKGARLATFAMWSIRAALQEQVVSSWSLVRIGTTATQRTLFLKLRRLSAEMMESADALGEEVYQLLAKRFDLPLAEVASLASRASGRDRSLDLAPPGREPLAESRPGPEEAAVAASEQRLWAGLLARAMKLLPEPEAMIIRARYLAERRASFAGIGRELGLSKERVRQIEARALQRLRETMEDARLLDRA